MKTLYYFTYEKTLRYDNRCKPTTKNTYTKTFNSVNVMGEKDGLFPTIEECKAGAKELRIEKYKIYKTELIEEIS